MHARHVDVSPEVRALAARKLEAIARLLPPDATADIEFSEERNPRIKQRSVAEVTIMARGKVLRARAAGTAFGEAVVHAVRNVRQEASDLHHRRRAHPHRGLKAA
ncbi:MAG: HPF/RaiA family ribosome-associated protein [Gaiellales bacterium]